MQDTKINLKDGGNYPSLITFPQADGWGECEQWISRQK